MSHIYKRGEIFWIKFYKNGKAHYDSLGTKDRTTALYLKSKADQDIIQNKYIVYDKNVGCDKIIDEFLQEAEHRNAKHTIDNDRIRIESFLSHRNIKTLENISEKHLQEYLNTRISRDKIALPTANRLIATIKAWLNFAVRRKYIHENPLKDFRKYRLQHNLPKFLSKDEIDRIMTEAKGTRLYPLLMTALYTGMRLRELQTLEWTDIDFDQNTVTVQNKSGFTTKSKRFRIIPLHLSLCAALLPLRKTSGTCFDMTNHKKIFLKILKEAKVNKVGYHHFRHAFASHLCMSGVDLYSVSQLLGHSDIKVTQIYAHLTKDHIKTAIDKLKF